MLNSVLVFIDQIQPRSVDDVGLRLIRVAQSVSYCNPQVEPEGTSELPAASKALFLDKVRQSNTACQSGDYATAVSLYTDALQLDPSNHILYSNRSAALVKMGQFAQALQDAIRARELNSKWPKVREHKPSNANFTFTRLV